MEISLNTTKKQEIIDITSKVQEIVSKSNIKDGLCLVYSKHTTASLLINENEKRLLEDIEEFLESLASSSKKYKHDDLAKRDCPPDERINAHSHLKSLLLKTSEIIPINNKKLNLGKYQAIIFVELDGPRKNRNIIVKVLEK